MAAAENRFWGELITDFSTSFSFADVIRLSPEFPPRAAMWRIRRLGSHAIIVLSLGMCKSQLVI